MSRMDKRRQAEEYTRQGDELQRQGRLKESLGAYGRANQTDPGYAPAWYAAGCALNGLKEFSYAVNCFRKSIGLQPGHMESHHNLGKALYQLGLIDEAIGCFRAAVAIQDNEPSRAALATILPGSPKATHQDVLEARRAWANAYLPAPREWPKGTRRDGPLRVGYISAFFGSENWMKPVWGLINQHDREAVQLFLYSDGPLEACGGYRRDERDEIVDISGLSNEEAAQRIAASDLDILVDLNSYSAVGRLPVIARKPAPVVASWFNLYATAGIPACDYLIGDPHVIRPEEEKFYSEKIVRAPGSYLTFDVQYAVPDVAPPPALRNGYVTFGCFASLYKLTPEVLAAWAEILRRAPSARLMLKNGLFQRPRNQDTVLEVLKERVAMEGRSPHFEYLAAYAEVDIALDPFPYNGGTTTTEALWQGVPVVCFDGDRWAARQGVSLLRTAGLEEFTAPDLRGYIELAVALANDPGTPVRLAELRAGMRERLRGSAVCDTAGFARAMEELYRQLTTPV